MEAAELLRVGRLADALEKLQEQVRADPSNHKHRIFLFQLLAVMGRWDRALTQLNLAAEMNAECLLMAQVCRQAIQCEALRAEIYLGRRMPMIFGEPEEWVGWIVQANQLLATGKAREAAALREKAFESAPAVAGNVDGESFEWIADADPRMGPMLEAIVEGKYFWIPMQKISRIAIEKPADLRDLVWAPATFTWANGGSAAGLIPARYPGTETSEDNGLRMCRGVEWLDAAPGFQTPIGQRILATDRKEYPLLEIRQIQIGAAPAEAAGPGTEAGHG